MCCTEPDRFVEAIVAPGFRDDARHILTTKPKWKANVRLLASGGFRIRGSAFRRSAEAGRSLRTAQLRQIDGGFLVQNGDTADDPRGEWKCVTDETPTSEQLDELVFGRAIVRHVKSNAITLSKDRALVASAPDR